MKKKELLEEIKNQKRKVYDLVEKDDLDGAEAAKKELQRLQNKYELIEDLEDAAEEDEGGGNGIKNQIDSAHLEDILNKRKKEQEEKNNDIFAKGIKAFVGAAELNAEERKIFNIMREGTGADGGYTVPQDIQTKIRELRRSEDALEDFVNVEPVSTESGSRVIEELADHNPFDVIGEESEFPELETPKVKKIEYKVKKYGGILRTTEEVYEDSSENINNLLIKWGGKKGKATRNFLIIKRVKEMTAGKEKEIKNLDDLKDIFNVVLDPSIAVISTLVTNQDGYNWLDKLKDADGNYLLQPDASNKTTKLLFGQYPVKKLGNKTLKTESGKIPFIIGSLKEAITIFDRQKLAISLSSLAKDFWETDTAGIKVRERLDVKAVDEDAIVMGYVVTTGGEVSAASVRAAKK